MVEHFMTTLIWNYVGGHEVGMAVTKNIGNRSKAEMLLELAERFEKNDVILDHIKRAVKVFSILKDNRNMLMHSHSVFPTEDGDIEWRRQHPNSPMGSVGMHVNLQQMYELRDTICNFGKYITKIYIHANPRLTKEKAPEMGALFPMPKRFAQLPSESQRKDK